MSSNSTSEREKRGMDDGGANTSAAAASSRVNIATDRSPEAGSTELRATRTCHDLERMRSSVLLDQDLSNAPKADRGTQRLEKVIVTPQGRGNCFMSFRNN